MSGRFVRASKFRNVHADPPPRDETFTELRPVTSGEGNFIKANNLYWAIAVQGGGGPFIVHPLNKPTRFPASPSVVNVHKGKVLDLDFHPFHSDLIASCSEDCTIKMTKIPEGGLTETITTELASLKGHLKRVSILHFHPTAENVLASIAYDNTVKVWDVEAQSQKYSFDDHPDFIQSFEWNRNGSLIATTCKDKQNRVLDPRKPNSAITFEGHPGAKSSRCMWMDNRNALAFCGFSKNSTRKITLYDTRKLGDSPISEVELDQSAGVLIPYYDEDASMLYVTGKGDGNIRFFEIVDEAPFIHPLSEYRTNTPHKGVGFASKLAVNYMGCEIAFCLRLLRDSIEPVHFLVPRKSGADLFQSDLYPETFTGEPSMKAADYFAGKDKDPRMGDFVETVNAKNKAPSGGGTQFKAKVQKSAAELEKELADAHAKIAQLEAKIAQLQK